MSQLTRDEMTIAQWLVLCPTTEEMASTEDNSRDQAHKELICALFENVDKGQHASLITDAVGALYVAHPAYCVKVLEYLFAQIKRDFLVSQIPDSLKQLLVVLMDDSDA